MRDARSGPVQLFPGLEAQRDLVDAAEINNFLEARASGPAGDQDTVNWLARQQRFTNGMDSGEDCHYNMRVSFSERYEKCWIPP